MPETPDVPVAAERIRGAGVELAVYRQGAPDGPVVLLVHGYPDTHAVWDEVAGLLAGRFQVVRYDVRGAGASDHPAGREHYTFEPLMADLRAVLDAVSPDRPVHLVGHDWGSIQGWEAVCTMPHRFASFTSISGPCLDHAGRWLRGKVRRPTPRNLRQAGAQALRSWYIAWFRSPLAPHTGWRPRTARLFFGALRLAEGVRARPGHPAATLPRDGGAGVWLYRADMPERMRAPRERATTVPAQVVVPTRDLFVSPHLAGDVRRLAPHAVVRRIPTGHWVIRTHPGLIARLVREHAEGTGRTGRDSAVPGG